MSPLLLLKNIDLAAGFYGNSSAQQTLALAQRRRSSPYTPDSQNYKDQSTAKY